MNEMSEESKEDYDEVHPLMLLNLTTLDEIREKAFEIGVDYHLPKESIAKATTMRELAEAIENAMYGADFSRKMKKELRIIISYTGYSPFSFYNVAIDSFRR